MRILLAGAFYVPTLAFAEDVTLDNLVRAETDHMIRTNMEAMEAEAGKIVHQRDIVDFA